MYMRRRRPRSIAVSAAIVVSLSVLSTGCATGSGTARTTDSASPGSATTTAEPSAADSASTPASQPPASPSTEAAEPLKDGAAVLVSCPSPSDPRATVKVTNPNGRDGTFAVKMDFLYAQGSQKVKTRDPVWVPAKETTTYRVRVTTAGVVDSIDRCNVERQAAAVQ
ncbi:MULTISPECIES: hypothetical protein [unclassified Streptomyces]|uniref:hypothetical protein n=1 Tax=unclassified Streptomyces TaxID=2593676 RepID=UPI0033F2E9A0